MRWNTNLGGPLVDFKKPKIVQWFRDPYLTTVNLFNITMF